jgi:hypothetical protein
VHRHAGHGDRVAAGGAALGQGDVEQARRPARIVVEELVEIAHPEEQQDVRVLRLGGEVLAHERRVLRCTGRGGRSAGFGGGDAVVGRHRRGGSGGEDECYPHRRRNRAQGRHPPMLGSRR